MAASIRTASSGGSHSGKKGLAIYFENVNATIATVQGLTIKHSAHSLMNPTNGPKV